MEDHIKKIYPLSTRDKQAIPFEVLRPLLFKSLSDGDTITLPFTDCIILAEATYCTGLLLPGNGVALPGAGEAAAAAMYIPWGIMIAYAPATEDLTYTFRVLEEYEGAKVNVMVVDSYKALDNPSAFRKNV